VARLKIAVLSDLHFGPPSALAARRSEIADILLLRLVRRLNRHIQPDVTVILGDLLDQPDSVQAPERLAEIRQILDLLKSPWIVLPGNHDPDPPDFHKILPQSPEILDLGGARFLPFCDKNEPGYNASRSEQDIARMDGARQGYDGPLIALQHVSQGPPEKMDVWFRYLNSDAILDAMRRNRVALSLSGHAHVTRHVRQDGMHFVVAPALCESPFRYLIVTLDGEKVEMEEQSLAMPPELRLTDWHVHTEFAYCGENMRVDRAVQLAREFGVGTLCFAEHSGQLLFSSDTYWHGDCFEGGIESRRREDSRVAQYLEAVRPYLSAGVRCGFEADCDFRGRLLITPEAASRAEFIIGSVHQMAVMKNPDPPMEQIAREHRFLLESMLRRGIRIFAHPFRVWEALGKEIPVDEMRQTASLLKNYGAAAEMNFHNRPPNRRFMEICLDMGVPISLGSDSHNLCDIGEFWPHLRLLEELGAGSDLEKVLVPNLDGASLPIGS